MTHPSTAQPTSSSTQQARTDLDRMPAPPNLIVRPEMIDPFERGSGVTTLPYVGSWNTEHNHVSTGETQLEPGASIPEHTHNVEETVLVLGGSAECTLAGESFPLETGDATWIPAGQAHGFRNTGDSVLRIFWVYAGRDVSRTFSSTGQTVPHLSADDRA